jgi:hypothetical protein
VVEVDHFINLGYGWVCKHCSADDLARNDAGAGRGRFFAEGEAEDKEPALSTPALARWANATRQALVCPRCGVEETIGKA